IDTNINQRFINLNNYLNNEFGKINNLNQIINTNIENTNQRIFDNNQNLNINFANLFQRINNNNENIGTSFNRLNEILNNMDQNINNINFDNTRLDNYMITLENLQNQLIPRNDNYETLFNNFRNDIRTMVFNQLNANQREILQRIIRVQQPKRMSITQRRTWNFQMPRTQRSPRQITGTIMTDLEIHSQSGSSVGRAEYNPESSG
ncbi:17546_t:CDS:1, partial [Cetraspora pellucida]